MRWVRKHVGLIAGTAVGGFLLWVVATAVTIQSVGAQSAGTLFGRKVSLEEFRGALEAATHQAVLTYGDRYRDQVPPSELVQQAWERLILLKEADRKRIRAADQEVVEELGRLSLFRTADGRFDTRGYEAVIRYTLGTSPRLFEEETRQSIRIRKLIETSVKDPSLTEEEIRQGFRRQEEAIRVSFLLLPANHEALARELTHAARQRPRELERLAGQLKLKLTQSDLFKRGSPVPEMGTAGVVLGPAFELEPGQVAGAPLRSPRGWLVVRLEEKQAPDESKLADAREALEKTLKNQKRFKEYLTWYQGLLNRAQPKLSLPREAKDF